MKNEIRAFDMLVVDMFATAFENIGLTKEDAKQEALKIVGTTKE